MKGNTYLLGNAGRKADFTTSIEFSPSKGSVKVTSLHDVNEVSLHAENTWLKDSTTQILVGLRRRGRQEIPTAVIERVSSEDRGLRRAIIEVNLTTGSIKQEASLLRGRRKI